MTDRLDGVYGWDADRRGNKRPHEPSTRKYHIDRGGGIARCSSRTRLYLERPSVTLSATDPSLICGNCSRRPGRSTATTRQTDVELARLYNSGMTEVRHLANEVNMHPDSVTRALRRIGLRETKTPRPYSTEELERIASLTLEGVPATWIAEDIGRNPESVRTKASKMPGALERTAQWSQVWSAIRRAPTLLELHRQFAPQRTEIA
jgi:hypothetical protein